MAAMDGGKTLTAFYCAQELYQLLNHADGASKVSLKLDWGDRSNHQRSKTCHQIWISYGFIVPSALRTVSEICKGH